MASVRSGRRMRLGPYGKAWAFLVPGVAFLVVGLVLNKAVNPSKVPKHTVLEVGGLVIVLWIVGALLVVVGAARFRRAAREDRRERSRAAARQLALEQLAEAGRMVEQLLAGALPAVEQVWDVVLRPDERALFDGRLAYSRFYGTGTAASHAAARPIAKARKRTRAQEVAWALAPRWRDQQQARVVVTDQRLLCQVNTHGWLSFEHKVATAIKALPESPSLVLEYPGTSPLCVSGPGAVQLMVVVVWALHGADGLREHPALAQVRAAAVPPPATMPSESATQPAASASAAARAEITPAESDATPTEVALVTARPPSAERSGDLLEFLAANELVLAQHVADLLQISTEEATERLELLRVQGVVSRVHADPRQLAAYRITPEGAKDVDPALPPLRALELARLRHDAAAAWLWTMARNGRFGPQRAILSRREMQAADATARTATLISTAGATFRDQPSEAGENDVDLVYRDLALVQPRGNWQSVDVVLSPPDAERLRTTISHARRDQTLSQQLFIVNGDPRIRELIERVAGELGLADRVAIQSLDPAAIAGG